MKILNNIKCKREVYHTYGRVAKVNLSHVLIALDFVIPTCRLLTLFAIKYCNFEIFRITTKR